MYRVRYYDQVFHPDHFRKSGWRGAYIVLLNWIRWALETYVQKQVLLWLSKEGAIPTFQTGEYLRSFKLDVRAEKLEKEQTSPLHEKLLGPNPDAPSPVRSDRYEQGSVKSALASESTDSGLPDRPMRLDNLIGSYGMQIRAKKYAKGNRYQVTDPDGDFVLLEDASRGNSSGLHEVGDRARGTGGARCSVLDRGVGHLEAVPEDRRAPGSESRG